MTTDPRARHADVLHLRTPGHRVERRAIVWWTLQSLISGAIVLGGLLVAYYLIQPARVVLGPVILVAVAVALAILGVFAEPWLRYAVHRWESTNEAVYATTGWLVREWRIAPISRIQTVDTVRGPLEQLLGLATLRVTTASARGPIDIGGLDAEVAADLARELMSITRQTFGDAT